ncbi:MAG: glycosyltransferase [Bacteroides sp.]|nr:glycosyltransferase [Bacteroides sp.]
MKQRILLVNKFYYRRGGAEGVVINLEQALRGLGHEVAVFSMDFPENIDSDYARYFVPQVEFFKGFGAKVGAMRRTLGLDDLRSRFESLLDDFKPDVVHLHNVHSYLCPLVGELAHRRGIKVVWTLHDYKIACPAYSCLRDGKVCELCFHDKKQVLLKRCMKNSLPASVLAYMEALVWNRKRLTAFTDTFICPSGFIMDKMISAGYPADKMRVLCNFVAPEIKKRYDNIGFSEKREPFYCYVGRLSAEKGLPTLIKAASRLPYKLKIAGRGPMESELKAMAAPYPNIEFVGSLSPAQVADLLSKATFSVVCSECYENNPLSAIESLCAGTPVIGARIGGIPELIGKESGIIYESGNVPELVKAIDKAWNFDWDYRKIMDSSRHKFSAAVHCDTLTQIYEGK